MGLPMMVDIVFGSLTALVIGITVFVLVLEVLGAIGKRRKEEE